MEKNFHSVEDVMGDELFLSWYFKDSHEKIQAWEQWITANPQTKPLVTEAVSLMSNLHVNEAQPGENQTILASQQLNTSLDSLDTASTPVVAMKHTNRRLWLRISAAAAILVVVGLLAIWKFSNSRETFATSYGQLRQHILPDGSEVMLNANSSVQLGSNWDNGKDREVWLQGEAFFHVKKTSSHDRFIVHANHMDIIVTGTQFNVITRDDKTSVLLTEGSVIVRSKDGKEIKMMPGDFVELNGNEQPEKKTANEDVILAWKDNKIFFLETPMPEAAKIITDHYGVKVTLADEVINSDSLSGMMPNDNLDVLIRSLEIAKNWNIQKKDNEIIISKL